MQDSDIIRAGLAYIEQNLKTDITPKELSQMAGYSVWHYQRLFAQVVGVPLAEYVNRRRLDSALAEISANRKAIDAAMEYGFDSYAGFYKAFLRMYGCSPKKYLSLYGTHQPIPEVITMFIEAELRKILDNWDIPKDLSINDVKIVDGTKTANNIFATPINPRSITAALITNANIIFSFDITDVWSAICFAVYAKFKLSFIKTTSAASIAKSEPF